MIKIKGFTLIEVLLVVIILGILASLVMPRFFGQTERGVVAEAVSTLSAIRQAESSWYLENSSTGYTDTLTDLDIDITSTKFTYAVDTTTGTATATRVSGDTFNNKTIILKMDGTWDTATQTHPFAPQ